jgi:putative toxin-antitoxin system antitoxin component (TIGR02293 family)
VARLIGISDRTLSRRLADSARMTVVESDRIVRLARVVAIAADTLGTTEKAARWLQQPNRALEGSVPLELLDTDTGTRAVETIFGRIEWGLYS